jgi:molybdopterin-guanine dinucleotide biosynthesis protein A
MGRDKYSVEIEGVPLALRVARVLQQVAYPVLAVGPEAGTGLFSVDDSREGPLAAFAAGMGALAVRGHEGPVLLVACDLPLITAPLLRFIANSLGPADAAVPVAGDQDQPLCACFAARAAGVAARLAQNGSRSMRDLIAELSVRRIPANEWDHIAPPSALLDVDTPEELEFVIRILDEPA